MSPRRTTLPLYFWIWGSSSEFLRWQMSITWSSGITEFWFLDGAFLLLFAFRCIRHMLPHIWPHIVGSWCRLFPRQSHPGPCITIRWFPIQYNESREACPCNWQFSVAINVPVIVNLFLRHHIQSCMCISGNANVLQWNWDDSAVGTYSLTRGFTWWR